MLAAPLLPETVERLKKLRHFFRRQPHSAVLDGDAYMLRRAGALHIYRAIFAVVFYRIGKQVEQNLLDAGSIRIGKAGVIEGTKINMDTLLLRLRFDHGLTFEQDFSH